jgi:hypothetical protein
MRGTVFVIACGLFILGAVLAYQEKKIGAIIVFIGGALCYAFANLEQFKKIKAWKFEAELWKEKKEEVDTTLNHLRQFATTTTQATLSDLMAGAFMGSMTLAKRLEIHKNIMSNLRDIGATEEQTALAEREWRKGVSVIYLRQIQVVLEERKSPNTANFETPPAKKQASDEINGLLDFKKWDVPTPDQMRALLKKNSVTDAGAELWIDDYEHFLKHNKIRRIDKFIAARDDGVCE